MSTPNQKKPVKFSILRVLGVILPVIVVGGLILMFAPGLLSRVLPESIAGGDRMERTLGIRPPVANRLAPRFADRSGNLLADAPEQAEQWINPPVLTFAYIPEEDPRLSEQERLARAEAWREAFGGLMAQIRKTTGREVEYRLYTDRNAQELDIKHGKLHIAGLNTGSVPFAVNRLGFIPAFTVADENGEFGHRMAIIVRKESRIRSIQDIKGQQFTLTRPGSNSGYTAPLLHLRDHGFDLNKFNPPDVMPVLSYSHTASIAGVADGQYTVAAVADDVLEKSEAYRQGKLRVIDRSPRFPGPAIGWVHNLEPDLAGKIREAFATYAWDDALVDQFETWGGFKQFRAIDYREDWGYVRSIDDRFGIDHARREEQLTAWAEIFSEDAE
ncbi:MAG: PhnD/SsuA/transferrin family substrate-binding protein [Phycisphaeraceae bacterium]|nr:PhnD/SsuA/transferrin family substrate-binding protein [Phycisphaeraceae bacterium]